MTLMPMLDCPVIAVTVDAFVLIFPGKYSVLIYNSDQCHHSSTILSDLLTGQPVHSQLEIKDGVKITACHYLQFSTVVVTLQFVGYLFPAVRVEEMIVLRIIFIQTISLLCRMSQKLLARFQTVT